ncbi:hypothetical protein STXM2123_4170 [Streptomyces sp. F-3]|nr:hypothetical protein STXM2123_4170 [Streptomyces sp. F-3]
MPFVRTWPRRIAVVRCPRPGRLDVRGMTSCDAPSRQPPQQYRLLPAGTPRI